MFGETKRRIKKALSRPLHNFADDYYHEHLEATKSRVQELEKQLATALIEKERASINIQEYFDEVRKAREAKKETKEAHKRIEEVEQKLEAFKSKVSCCVFGQQNFSGSELNCTKIYSNNCSTIKQLNESLKSKQEEIYKKAKEVEELKKKIIEHEGTIRDVKAERGLYEEDYPRLLKQIEDLQKKQRVLEENMAKERDENEKVIRTLKEDLKINEELNSELVATVQLLKMSQTEDFEGSEKNSESEVDDWLEVEKSDSTA
ncbi:unnamed protein product [Bursaphelenchus okinawaensis]|uniref:Uncharacterized protein n=1 Tax=Bursaphelenchus okinawaensis TaxID=465554 RepID=A0A811KDK1_9BILA|nr:unnamed protein product [Bursaphelenchus okinawaensis]CAG9101721.1 unnamed protein product [Bursaphelenchus okinawaensis]